MNKSRQSVLKSTVGDFKIKNFKADRYDKNKQYMILNQMMIKLSDNGYSKSMIKSYINNINKIFNNEFKKKERYFITIIKNINDSMPILLVLIYNEIKLYYEILSKIKNKSKC